MYTPPSRGVPQKSLSSSGSSGTGAGRGASTPTRTQPQPPPTRPMPRNVASFSGYSTSSTGSKPPMPASHPAARTGATKPKSVAAEKQQSTAKKPLAYPKSFVPSETSSKQPGSFTKSYSTTSVNGRAVNLRHVPPPAPPPVAPKSSFGRGTTYSAGRGTTFGSTTTAGRGSSFSSAGKGSSSSTSGPSSSSSGGPPKKALPTRSEPEESSDHETKEPTPKPPPALTGDARRDQIANELLATERTYVEWLTICVEHFLKPLRGEESTVLPQEKVNSIFSNIEDILQMNTLLLHDLEERMENWNASRCIGDLFLQMAPFLRIYSAYVSNFDDASSTLEACEKQPGFASFLKVRFEDPACKNQPLRSFLILPVQRIPRYRLLLEDMVKNTKETHPDYAQITESLTAIKEVAVQINESIKKHENRMKIVAIQERINSLMSNLNLVEAHRLFIREGQLMKVCRKAVKPRECYLFNDLFFYASVLPTGGLLIHRVIGLSELTVVDIPDTESQKFAFRIGSIRKSFVLCAETQEEKADWLVDIFNAIGDFKRAKGTLKLDEDLAGPQVPAGEAPVWQPDGDVSHCPLCQVEFSIFVRRHHCRSCGKVVCSNCSQHKLILPIDSLKQRVCDTCYDECKNAKASIQA